MQRLAARSLVLTQQYRSHRSCCTHTAEHARPHLVGDATVDAEHRANPLVQRFGLASYAGVPVHQRDGSVTGTVCVLDTRPRTFTSADVHALQHLAQQVQQLVHRPSAI
ncbi:GAF domain-containing protein [Kineococcus sp. SYSU DK005]|uniref:GAF domain-containing protein n=1 Tax=Kineococcus sp. SYSU DK005 TaxID=3383126 RepID=UPI003D7E2E80